MDKQIVGIAWFNESDWDEWKKISEDELEDNLTTGRLKLLWQNQNLRMKDLQ